MGTLLHQAGWLFLLALPIASVSWTITHEELFREFKEGCSARSASAKTWLGRKCYYVFTCEYCLSHYVAFLGVGLTGFRLLLPDWRGFVIAVFALVWVSNQYMSLFGRLRLDISRERSEIRKTETEVERTSHLNKVTSIMRAEDKKT